MLNSKQKREGYLPLRNPIASAAPQGAARTPAVPMLGPRRTSPGTEARRPQRTLMGPAQLAQPVRQRDKFVLLPDGTSSLMEDTSVPTIFEDIEAEPPQLRGRITVCCVSETLDRKALETMLATQFKADTIHSYPEVLHVQASVGANGELGDIFFFDYGVMTFWGLTQEQEQEVMRKLGTISQIQPLPRHEVQVDDFQFNYSAHEPPHMSNDTITINRLQAQDHQVKLAISHALAQSTKLSVYEQRVMDIVSESRHLPETLAKHGTIYISQKKVAQLIGKVFLQRSAVNLLSTVLDTPEFFWSAPDSLQNLYERVCEYLELDTRVEVVNARFEVLSEMLDMLRDHQNNHHTVRLEWIIIWLIFIELVVGLFQLMGLFGLVGKHSS